MGSGQRPSAVNGLKSWYSHAEGDFFSQVLPFYTYCICFLLDPSPIIGNACQWLTDSLTHSCLVNLIDVAFEDANSKLVEFVTVADVDDEKRVGWSISQLPRNFVSLDMV